MTEINEWLERCFQEGDELSFVVNGAGDDHLIVVPDTESEHAPDADAYVVKGLAGEVQFPGGE